MNYNDENFSKKFENGSIVNIANFLTNEHFLICTFSTASRPDVASRIWYTFEVFDEEDINPDVATYSVSAQKYGLLKDRVVESLGDFLNRHYKKREQRRRREIGRVENVAFS